LSERLNELAQCNVHNVGVPTIDTLQAAKELESAGMATPQAESVAQILDRAVSGSGYVTRQDVELALAPIDAKLDRTQWLVGLNAVAAGVILAKLFVG
jgi:hypothetical protein